ncbi:MAG: IS1595 family transposase [Reichenbachiella sp.]
MIEEFKGTSLIDFIERFPNEEKCKYYLADIKWRDGFLCSKCSNTTFWAKKEDPFHKVCKSCRHCESVTANTLFHKVKFDLRKAFFIIFEMSTTTKSYSALAMASKYSINRKTAWLFMHKVRKAMASAGEQQITDNCEVDEAILGQKVSGKRGRGALKKKKVSIVIEKAPKGGISRAYARSIVNFSAKELGKLFDSHIDKRVRRVDTDEWKGYLPLIKDWNIVQTKSNPGVNFNLMHRFIQQLKGWLRGIHHHASEKYLQGYLDEYCYRFNRHGAKNSIFDNAINRMMHHLPVNHKLLKMC